MKKNTSFVHAYKQNSVIIGCVANVFRRKREIENENEKNKQNNCAHVDRVRGGEKKEYFVAQTESPKNFKKNKRGKKILRGLEMI